VVRTPAFAAVAAGDGGRSDGDATLIGMSLEIGIWRVDGEAVRPLPSSALVNEKRLEDILERDITILGLDVLLIVGRQLVTEFGGRLDLLAIDSEGSLSCIEVKKGRTPREVVAQALDYGYWLRGFTMERLVELYMAQHGGADLFTAFRERFDLELPDELTEEHQLVIVASELDPATERIVEYVAGFGVPINVVFFRYFADEGREYIARSWLLDPSTVEARAHGAPPRKQKAPWNGQDFYVSFGNDAQREWEDARKYGFVSAGGGKWFSQSLNNLFPGARVFVCIPKAGYVGVGTVIESVQRVSDFTVEVDGDSKPILEAPLSARGMGQHAGDAELSEYVVRVKWIKTVPKEQAIWEKGMFANQNSAARLRNQFTLTRLTDRFGLDGDST
jgi:hypothetical protein